jgi:hypothetical protein
MAPFIIMPYLSDVEKKAWMTLTKVFKVLPHIAVDFREREIS